MLGQNKVRKFLEKNKNIKCRNNQKVVDENVS